MVSRTTSLLDSLYTTKAVASYSTATEILCERAEPELVGVLLRRESGCRPLAGIDTQPRTLDVLVIDDPLAVAGRDVVAARVVRNFNDFPEELVRLLLARACVLVAPTAPLSRHYPMMHGTPARVLAQHLGRNLRFK